MPRPGHLIRKLWRKEEGKLRLKCPPIEPKKLHITILRVPFPQSGQHGPSALKAVAEEPRQDLDSAKAPLVQEESPRFKIATLPHVI